MRNVHSFIQRKSGTLQIEGKLSIKMVPCPIKAGVYIREIMYILMVYHEKRYFKNLIYISVSNDLKNLC